jgi:hypothetical protein
MNRKMTLGAQPTNVKWSSIIEVVAHRYTFLFAPPTLIRSFYDSVSYGFGQFFSGGYLSFFVFFVFWFFHIRFLQIKRPGGTMKSNRNKGLEFKLGTKSFFDKRMEQLAKDLLLEASEVEGIETLSMMAINLDMPRNRLSRLADALGIRAQIEKNLYV